MGKRRCGNFIFEWWKKDHSPRHIHIYEIRGKKKNLGRFNIEEGKPLDPRMKISKKLRKALIKEGFIYEKGKDKK